MRRGLCVTVHPHGLVRSLIPPRSRSPCRGGGGAWCFSRGAVLDALARSDRGRSPLSSGTSAGAFERRSACARHASGGRRRRCARCFGRAFGTHDRHTGLSVSSFFTPSRRSPELAPATRHGRLSDCCRVAPQFNPLGLNPCDLRRVDNDRCPRGASTPHTPVNVAATMRTAGRCACFRPLRQRDLFARRADSQAVACPTLHHAWKHRGRPYWDGVLQREPCPSFRSRAACVRDLLAITLMPHSFARSPSRRGDPRNCALEFAFGASFLRDATLPQSKVDREAPAALVAARPIERPA